MKLGQLRRKIGGWEQKSYVTEENKRVHLKGDNNVLFCGIAGQWEPDAGTEVCDSHNVECELEKPGVHHRYVE